LLITKIISFPIQYSFLRCTPSSEEGRNEEREQGDKAGGQSSRVRGGSGVVGQLNLGSTRHPSVRVGRVHKQAGAVRKGRANDGRSSRRASRVGGAVRLDGSDRRRSEDRLDVARRGRGSREARARVARQLGGGKVFEIGLRDTG